MFPPPVDVIIADVLESKGDGENLTRFPPPEADETNPESDRIPPLPAPPPDRKTSSDIESGGVGFVGVPPLLVPPWLDQREWPWLPAVLAVAALFVRDICC